MLGQLVHHNGSATYNATNKSIVIVAECRFSTSGGGWASANHSVKNMTLILSNTAVSSSATSDNARGGTVLSVYKAESKATLTLNGQLFTGVQAFEIII